jgi:16S rRNA (adenine1518-N6/adenine1519-N6)-dimethyltransferase
VVSGQGSIRRLREFGVRPNRELGQNFLVDDNVLRVVAEAGELASSDVVLEVGGGLGVLSEHLAPRVRHLHVVEVDRGLEPPLRDALAPFENVDLHLADAVELDLAALRPAPGKVVANLPYGVAATVILKSLEELPGATLWIAMVQLEVGQRLAAAPGSKAYGAASVIAQLSAEVKLLRRISRNVFRPVPNVESALVRLRRVGPPPDQALVALVHAAFAHRRKALPRSLAHTGGDRARAQEALVAIGHPPDARAERLSADDFRRLAEILAA